jgi:hypothetical protein
VFKVIKMEGTFFGTCGTGANSKMATWNFFEFFRQVLNHGPIRKKKQEKYFLANKHLPEELAFKVMGIGPFQIQISLYNRECEFIRIF